MIALFKMEFYKLWHRRSFLILIICLLGSNIGYLCYAQLINNDVPISVIRAVDKALYSHPNAERYDYLIQYQKELDTALVSKQIQELTLQNDSDSKAKIAYLYEQYPELKKGLHAEIQLQFSDNIDQECLVLDRYISEMSILHNYKTYLNKIVENAEQLQTISLFQHKDAYAIRNIEKTARDYQNLQTTTITYSSEKGIVESLSITTSMMLCIALFAIAIYVIMEEKERNLFCLIKTTPNGQGKIILMKLLVMSSSMLLLTIVFFSTNLMLMNNMYGLGDIGRSLQSLASYSKCTLTVSVLTFLIIFLILKWMTLCCLGALILFVVLVSKNRFIGIASVLGLLLIGYLFSTFIDANGPFNIFRYCNFYTLLQSETLLQQYVNFSFFHQPVSLRTLSILFIIVCFVVFHSVCIFTYLKKRNLQTSDITLPFHLPQRNSPCSLWRQELFKFFWLQKAGIFILLFILFQCYQYQNMKVYISQDERFYNRYMDVLEGPYTKEKKTFINEERDRFQRIHQKIASITSEYDAGLLDKQSMEQAIGTLDQQLLIEPTFQNIVQYVTYIEEDQHREFVKPYGHEQLFKNKKYIVYPTIFLILMLIFTLSNIFAFEYQHNVQKLLNVCILGRKKIFRLKITICICTTLLLSVVTYAPYFITMAQTYGLSSWQAPVSSIQAFSNIPSFIQIWHYYILIFGLRFIALFSFVSIMNYFVVRFKQQLTGIFFGFLIFFVPLLLSMMNIHVVDSFSLIPLLMPNNIYVTSVTLLGYLNASLYACFYIHKYHIS